MKQLLKRLFYYPWRLLYRLTCWINYPTSRERMWHMYALGKIQGQKEALKDLPIVQVQPVSQPKQVNLPPGQWMREWRASHQKLTARIYPDTTPAPTRDPDTGDDSWLTAPSPTKPRYPTRKLDEPDGEVKTEEMPAVVRLLHERRNGRG